MSVLDTARELSELIKKYNDQELYEKIVTLREQLLDLREENAALRERIKHLEDAQKIEARLIRKGNYYVTDDDPEGENNIYCLACWDHDRRLISLTRGRGTIKCAICSSRRKG